MLRRKIFCVAVGDGTAFFSDALSLDAGGCEPPGEQFPLRGRSGGGFGKRFCMLSIDYGQFCS